MSSAVPPRSFIVLPVRRRVDDGAFYVDQLAPGNITATAVSDEIRDFANRIELVAGAYSVESAVETIAGDFGNSV